jgi:hypothetical protein
MPPNGIELLVAEKTVVQLLDHLETELARLESADRHDWNADSESNTNTAHRSEFPPCYRLLATGYRLPATGYRLLFAFLISSVSAGTT